MKKIISLILIVLIVLSFNITVFAFKLPNSFWTPNSNYETAITTGNHQDIIKYGNQIISIVNALPDCAEKADILITRYNQVGLSYAEIGDYDSSAKMFLALNNLAENYGDKYFEYLRPAMPRVNQYTSRAELYTDGGTSPFYGAKNEKNNGVLFGLCADAASRPFLENESMMLIYHILGDPFLPININYMNEASDKGLAVEFALNCLYEGTDIQNITSKQGNLQEISNIFKNYPDMPIYLRFGAEFDVWSNQANPESYKKAFKYVADFFHTRNPNVAIVWSPNQVSGWYINTDDFYPGDSYVDWVGVSLYSQKYFQGIKNQKDLDQLFFRTGRNSDPVIAVKEIVEKYGNRKPIMISEGGCGHHLMSGGTQIENITDFALARLKEQLYYLPMVYPQIKLMAYFDTYVYGAGEKDDYRLSSNKLMQDEYIKITKQARFIQDGYSGSTDFAYRKMYEGITVESVFPVSCYAHKYNTDVDSVTYFIDGIYAETSKEIPYTSYINAENLSGVHTLKAVIQFKNGQSMETFCRININNSFEYISVDILGKKIQFDQKPILYNNRTMVPMRKIFEELGAKVLWDGQTQTATGVKGNLKVKFTVGSNIMYVGNKAIQLDTFPIVVSGRTLVPVRAIAEGMGCLVNWDDATKTVLINP